MNCLHLLAVSALLFGVSACASHPKQEEPEVSAQVVHNPDPWESVNRKIFVFNDKLDAWLLKPMAQGYKWVTPGFAQTGVSNFFDNLDEVIHTINYALQWKWAKAANDSGRFLINSTIGIGGLFDVAKHAGLEKGDPESFGQTFSYWGLPDGPYVVVPFLGSFTVTEALGTPIDWELHPIEGIDDKNWRVGLAAFDLLEVRASLLDAEKLISGDKYIFIRDAYLQRRAYLVQDGKQSESELDSFGEEFEGFGEGF